MATILIADDEKEIVSLLKFYLEAEGFAVLEAFDGKQAVHLLKNERIDLLIVDIMMSQMNGYELIKFVREKSDDEKSLIPLLVISAKTQLSDRIFGLDLGADDYIPKPFEPLEVVAKVKAQLRKMLAVQNAGGRKLSVPESVRLISAGSLVLNKDECVVSDGEKSFDLTKVELRVLEMFMEQPRRVFTVEQIYERGWGDSGTVDDNTIRVTISHLREKIGKARITNIRGLGYRFECTEQNENSGGNV